MHLFQTIKLISFILNFNCDPNNSPQCYSYSVLGYNTASIIMRIQDPILRSVEGDRTFSRLHSTQKSTLVSQFVYNKSQFVDDLASVQLLPQRSHQAKKSGKINKNSIIKNQNLFCFLRLRSVHRSVFCLSKLQAYPTTF